jgi:hypothetical protein
MKAFLILLVFVLTALVSAQDLNAITLTTPRWQTPVFAGPGITFERVGMLVPGQLVNILERNRLGTWLHVWQMREDGTVPINGWVEVNSMQLRSGLDIYTMVTENYWTLDADPTRIANPQEAILHSFPVIPRISDKMREVYALGQANGMNPAVITRVGDSLLNSEWYLLPMRRTDYRLGRYAFLEPEIRYFGPNMQWSIAVQKGLSTYTVHDPFWATAGCLANETPLRCEYRRSRPLAAFIMFGPNDVKNGTPEDYRANMARIVEESMAAGVIPILMTFSSHPSTALYARTLEYNVIVTELATQYEVPLLNVWLAMRTLPQYGLEQDLIHLKNSGYTFINFEQGITERSGVAMLNLLSLRMMQELRTSLGIVDPNAVPTPAPTLSAGFVTNTPQPTPSVRSGG